ncbi:MAG: EcsC family protein [Alphaproteobacteria bacterium]|nr:EcsC family protein [Alphaproteobacteria bacterium]
MTAWPESDRLALERAARLLEHPGVAIRIANRLGTPIEWAIGRLPAGVLTASRQAIETALAVAISTIARNDEGASRDIWHKVAAGAVGAAGGAFGMAGLAFELPVTTTVILRSVADIARSEGESLARVETRLACVNVLALGGRTKADDGADSAFLAARVALADALGGAAQAFAGQQASGIVAPAVGRLVKLIAQRFGIQVSHKVAAQALPVIGAAGGAILNVLFIDHFQDMARGYFTVRRLERRWGPAAVDTAYRDVVLNWRVGERAPAG